MMEKCGTGQLYLWFLASSSQVLWYTVKLTSIAKYILQLNEMVQARHLMPKWYELLKIHMRYTAAKLQLRASAKGYLFPLYYHDWL